MFDVKLKIPRYTINKEAYMQALLANLEKQLKEAAREFVRVAIQNIPVDTGQARGTFLPLSRFLNIQVATGGTPNGGKSASSGASGANQMLFKFETKRTQVSFKLDVQLFYFWVNDILGHPSGMYQPWESIDAGFKAFLQYLKEVAPQRFPKLEKYLKVEVKTYG